VCPFHQLSLYHDGISYELPLSIDKHNDAVKDPAAAAHGRSRTHGVINDVDNVKGNKAIMMFTSSDCDVTSRDNTTTTTREFKMVAAIQVWLGSAYIPGCMQNSYTIWRAIITFLWSSNTVKAWKLSGVCVSDNSNMAAMNRKFIRNYVYLSLYASNDNPTDMLSSSGNTTAPCWQRLH